MKKLLKNNKDKQINMNVAKYHIKDDNYQILYIHKF